MNHYDKQELLVIADENVEQLDILSYRIIFCFAEVLLDGRTKDLLRQIDEFGSAWEIGNPDRKFHLTDLNRREDIDWIINIITQIRPTVKLFVEYTIINNLAQSKGSLLQKSITTLMSSNYRTAKVKWIIENADEYVNSIKKDVLTKNKHMTIIADTFCSVFARKFSDRLDTESLVNLHRKLKPLVRLEYVTTQKKILPLDGIKVL